MTYYQRGGCDGSQGKQRRELPAKATAKQRAEYEAGYLSGKALFDRDNAEQS